MGYPDSSFGSGVVDAPFGGQPANRWGRKARAFIDAQIQTIQTLLLVHLWKPFSTQKVEYVNAVSVGDVLVFDLAGAGPDYSVDRLANVTYNADTTPRCGLAYEAGSAGATGYMITHGVGIPPAVHGLSAGTAGYVIMDTTTGRLARATGTSGELVIGCINSKGSVCLFPKTATSP